MNDHPAVCFYFQVHQPYRLRDIRITEIGNADCAYFDDENNRHIFRKVAEKCYLPANALLLDLLKAHPNFRIAYSLSGVFLDQCIEYGPDVLNSFLALAQTGQVEFLAETYYHSLSALHSLEEFCTQVTEHVARIEALFGQRPRVFRNTELIYNNELATIVREMGFRGMLAEGADHILQNGNPNDPRLPPQVELPQDVRETIALYGPGGSPQPTSTTLLKNYRLSDDVAFRFSDHNWIGHPLTAERFTDWLMQNSGHSVNLFMDYETFGEHQWADTGIFDFVASLPALWEERGIRTLTPSQVIDSWPKDWQMETYDVHQHISWADSERDLSAWQGNAIQDAAVAAVFALEQLVKGSGDKELLRTWRKLQTSDHFYYMCTKYWSDGDVHKYFSPYDSPYEAYRRFSHAITDLRHRLESSPPAPSA